MCDPHFIFVHDYKETFNRQFPREGKGRRRERRKRLGGGEHPRFSVVRGKEYDILFSAWAAFIFAARPRLIVRLRLTLTVRVPSIIILGSLFSSAGRLDAPDVC